ncbi:DUF6716 putative glycosyltransferase [Brevibacterium casei]|uniref:Uncharacterized protein n=1 Tax=Brevibacterium casei TaxID=33889 RepID=A0A269ZAU1_9MICO|nr:DUF6716 putative glycosyltransferase [Brevibacterium casei]MCT1550447.1 hypothetical protein [Brevibacterium casei]MCT1559141.1 hypothetical protein [Brevibacterium casei]MCT2206998.1 hypothetical protein [Brevibacterium casei]PAK94922.1 hypothetical protein B8X04_11790 [Brevibacterium casei]
MSIVSFSDSESYLKWATQLLSRLPGIDAHVYLIDNPILPTDEQIAHAVVGTEWEGRSVPVVSRSELGTVLDRHRPDIVLGAATGPIVAQLFLTATSLEPRPALVSGLPGMGLPASGKGMNYRRLMDAFVAHSHTEVAAYREASAEQRVPADILLGRLPMLRSETIPAAPHADALAQAPSSLIFAPQAKVPAEPADRESIITALAEFALRHPDSRTIVKMRSRPGEHETHREHHTYFDIIAEFKASGVPGADRLEIGYGPLSAFLRPGSGLVTLSSTAALESIDRSIPTLLISDFGFDRELLNEVYADSAAVGTLTDVAAGRIGFPSDEWLKDNYFHVDDGTLRRSFDLLAQRSRTGQLPDRRRAVWKQKRLLARAEMRTFTPAPIVDLYRRIRYGR